MKLLSSIDFAIAAAIKAENLKVAECWSARLGEPYWAIEDAYGVIECHLSAADAAARVDAIKGRLQ